MNLSQFRRRFAGLAVLLVSLVVVPQVHAQEAAAPAQEQPAETGEAAAAGPVPIAIPQTALLQRSDETATLLARAKELAVPDPIVVAIADAVTAETETLNRKQAELDLLSERTVSERTLTDQRERWGRSEERLRAWRVTIQGRLQGLIELNDAVQFERATWLLTQDSLIDAELGEEMTRSLETISLEIDGSLAELAPRLEATIELMNRLGRRLTLVGEALAELDALQAEIRGRILRRDQPPLWATPIAGLSTVGAEVRFAGAYWWETATDWARAHVDQLTLLGLFFAFYLAATLTLQRHRKAWPQEARFEAADFVASRPVATATLAALATGVFLLTPMTGPVQDAFRILVWFAVWQLATGLAPPLPARTWRGLLVLYFFEIAFGFVPDGSLIGRLLGILMAVGGVAFALDALRRWPSGAGWVWKTTRVLIAASAVGLAIGGGANFFGWVDLGNTIVIGLIDTSLAALAWLLLVRAIGGLLPLAQIGAVADKLTSVRESGKQFERTIMIPLTLLAVYGWADGTLRNFRVDQPFKQGAEFLLSASLSVGSLEISVRGVLSAVIILVVTAFVARIVRFVLSEEVFPRLVMRPGTKSTLVSLINYVIIAIGVVMAATAAGFNATQLTVVLGAMSVGIGFGLQAIVGNFVSGLILMFERPVAVGDQIEAGGFLGKITHIGIRASRVRTFDGSDVIIPNSELVTKQVRNWTLNDGTKRINLDLSVGLDSDPAVVMQIMNDAAVEHELALKEPAPRAVMLGYGDSSINFRLQVWLRVENAIALPSELHLTLIKRLRAVGVEIPAVRRERHEGSEAR